MLKPNYKDGSIVNLMSSIGGAFGAKLQYKPLKLLPPDELRAYKNIVLIVVDGLGYNYLCGKGKKTFLMQHLKGKITSVFPPTTASAVTTFQTGTAPRQHAFTGWFMNLKEIGLVTTILPFRTRAGKLNLAKEGFRMKDILDKQGFPSRISAKSFIIMDREIINSEYTKAVAGNAKRLGCTNLTSFFRQIKKSLLSSKNRKYIYAYWPWFDHIAHKQGISSRKSEMHMKEIDREFKKFIGVVKDTAIILTSDHGFIDSSNRRTLFLEEHPKLSECLSLPMCGDSRVKYCYVYVPKAKQFERYVKTKLKKCCYIFRSNDLINNNYFGLYKSNPKLYDRIGDYVLIMKENYAFKDKLLMEKMKLHPGRHSGMSPDELYVPLIVIKK